MADWRQIRARIRRAKAAPDAEPRLEQLFEKTRDGMVAFELAELQELAGQIDRATNWYKHAWERFRRAEWKKKAEDALTRLGVAIPTGVEANASTSAEEEEPPESIPPLELFPAPVEFVIESESEPELQPEPEPAKAETGTPARRRRRRGGRGRGRGRSQESTKAVVRHEPEAPPHPAVHAPTHTPSHAPTHMPSHSPTHAPVHAPSHASTHVSKELEPRSVPERRPAPAVHVYRRVGEPALASVIAAHEAKLRQLLAARAYEMEHIEESPASPGIYVVSDKDLTTVYYVEAYGNMRVAMEQLMSGRRGRQGSVRARLARYLGISDSQATRYLKQHCVVRWLEFEESDAVALAHFAAAVLRPELNEESE